MLNADLHSSPDFTGGFIGSEHLFIIMIANIARKIAA